MCFRPSEISLPVKCSECGTMNDPGTKACTKCGAELTAAAMPGMPGAPGAPAAPGAPVPPGAPAAPGAPKAPGAPVPPGTN